MLSNLVNVDRDLAGRVAAVLGVSCSGSKFEGRNEALCQLAVAQHGCAGNNPKSPCRTEDCDPGCRRRRCGGLQSVKSALLGAGVNVKVLSARLGELRGGAGGTVKVDDLLVAMPSIVFDAVYVPGGADSIAALKALG